MVSVATGIRLRPHSSTYRRNYASDAFEVLNHMPRSVGLGLRTLPREQKMLSFYRHLSEALAAIFSSVRKNDFEVMHPTGATHCTMRQTPLEETPGLKAVRTKGHRTTGPPPDRRLRDKRPLHPGAYLAGGPDISPPATSPPVTIPPEVGHKPTKP